MLRLLLLTLASCGHMTSVPPVPLAPHDHTACDDIWTANGFTDCEAACVDATTALNAMGAACDATTVNGPVHCQKTFTFQDATGCCASAEPSVLFADCT